MEKLMYCSPQPKIVPKKEPLNMIRNI